MVQVQRTSSNLLEPQQRRANTVCRGISQEFSVVRRYGTCSTYSFTEAKRCAGSSCTSSVWFKRIEPPRTFSNLIRTEIAGRVAFLQLCSGWFGCTEPPSLTTSLQGKQGVQGARALVRGGSRAICLNHPNLLHKHPAHCFPLERWCS